jgi:UDPglucose 6-dehydrogenase
VSSLPQTSEFEKLILTANVNEAFSEVDLVIVATDWPEYKNLDPGLIGGMVNARNVIDGRSIIQPDKWREAGWRVLTLGEGNSPVV